MTSIRAVFVVALSCVPAIGCGEHPCTLKVGEPSWCTAVPGEGAGDAPFCAEVCGVCETQGTDKWGTACRAHCRAELGMSDRTCEELDAAVEAAYRQCVQSSDHPGCGGHPKGAADQRSEALACFER